MKNNVELVVSNTYLSSFYHMLDEINDSISKDKFKNIILVVPDKFSLNAEQLFFKHIKTKSVFNVWLTTLSRLINKVLSSKNTSFKLLTKHSGVMLVEKIILKLQNELSSYRKIAKNYNFAEKMFNVINLLKSSGVSPDELKQNISDNNLGKKIKDIHLIYTEYQNYLNNETMDTITRLQLFNSEIKTNDYVQNSEIYFAMFDSFTNAQHNSLIELAKNCKGLHIGCCYNVLQKNKIIYDNVVFQRLKDAFSASNVGVTTTFCKTNLAPIQHFLLNNLFANTNNTFETDKVEVLEFDNINDEIIYVASKIKYLVMEKNYSFEDINVAINGLEDYKLEVKKVFNQFDLPYYIDTTKTLSEHYFVKGFLKILDFVCDKNSTVDAITIAKNPIFKQDSNNLATFENFCYQYNIVGDEFFKPFEFSNSNDCLISEKVRSVVFDNIKNLKEHFDCANNLSDFIDCFKKYFEVIDAKNVINEIAKIQTDSVDKKIDEQVYEKVNLVFEECVDMLKSEVVSKELMVEILSSGFETVKISTVPLKCNSVFVGDASTSTFIPKKSLIVVGSTESRMPKYSQDTGTLTDAEITNFKSDNRISPTIKELNHREKFKLFNLILNWTDDLTLTYSLSINGEVQKQSEFVSKICDILTKYGKKLPNISYSQFSEMIFDSSTQNQSAYLVGTLQNALSIASKSQYHKKQMQQMGLSDLLNIQEQKYQFKNDYQLKNAKEVLFSRGLTKISQIERYFDCPFKQFVDYGLRPKEHKKFEIQSVDVGNIMHLIAEKFVQYCIKNNYVIKNLNNIVKQLFAEIINTDNYKSLKSKTFALKKIEQECVRFCGAILHQIEQSDYKPKFTEYRFSNYELDSGLTIKGFVDRVDICKDNNSFRVVDYKTGKDKFSYANIYYGLKLQLPAYLKVLKDILGLNPVGTFYMPVKNNYNNYSENEFARYKLDGIMLNENSVLQRLDHNLAENSKSEIVNIAFTKSGELTKNSGNYALNQEELSSIMDYAFQVMNKAIDEMLCGYIQPKPYKKSEKTSCDYCQYKSVCRYKIQDGYRRLESSIEKDFFSEKE